MRWPRTAFLAARDGAAAALLDPLRERRVPVGDLLTSLVEAARPHARALGCETELGRVKEGATEAVLQELARAAAHPAAAEEGTDLSLHAS